MLGPRLRYLTERATPSRYGRTEFLVIESLLQILFQGGRNHSTSVYS